jgi:hypothetical protein
MDPAQGETQGKSMTSKLKAKVKGVKGKVHLPGHKKRQGEGAQTNEGDSSSGYSSDDAPKKPGPETGYNVGASTPFTTVRTTPLSPAREKEQHTTSEDQAPRSMDTDFQDFNPATEGMAKVSQDDGTNKPREGVLGKVKDSFGGAAATVGSTIGYYTEVDQTPVVPPPQDPNASTLMEKTKASLGLDKPSDPNAPTLMEKTKASLGLAKESGAGADVQQTFPAHSDYVQPVPHQSYGDRIG